MKKPLISVIVPIYNTEFFLQECLDSIKKQRYQNLEIILIDDGSTDGSLEICNLNSVEDTRIKVYSKENGGVASARNEGLKRATGDYITWVDSDDTIDDTYIYCLYEETLNNGDCPVIVLSKENVLLKQHIIKDNDIILGFLNGYIPSNMWSTLFRKELYNNVFFKKYDIGEDAIMLIELFSKVKKISCIYNTGYHYRENFNSLTRSNNKIALQSWISEINKQEEIITNKFPYASSLMSYKLIMFALGLLENYEDNDVKCQALDIIYRNYNKISICKLSKHQIKELFKKLFFVFIKKKEKIKL